MVLGYLFKADFKILRVKRSYFGLIFAKISVISDFKRAQSKTEARTIVCRSNYSYSFSLQASVQIANAYFTNPRLRHLILPSR